MKLNIFSAFDIENGGALNLVFLFSSTAIASELVTPCESSSKNFCRSFRPMWIHGRLQEATVLISPAKREHRSVWSAVHGCSRFGVYPKTSGSATHFNRCRTWSLTFKACFRFSFYVFVNFLSIFMLTLTLPSDVSFLETFHNKKSSFSF